LTAVSDVEISTASKLGQENAMQANIVESKSLQQPRKQNQLKNQTYKINLTTQSSFNLLKNWPDEIKNHSFKLGS
jgi:hypothetical protein